MKLTKKSTQPATTSAPSTGWVMDRRTFLRNSGSAAGGVAAAGLLPAMMKRADAATPAQAAELEAAGGLDRLLPSSPVTVIGGRVVTPFRLPRQGVSLVTLTWREDGGL